jgi:hypothetical protein
MILPWSQNIDLCERSAGDRESMHGIAALARFINQSRVEATMLSRLRELISL